MPRRDPGSGPAWPDRRAAARGSTNKPFYRWSCNSRIITISLATVIEACSYRAGLWVTAQPATAGHKAATATPARGIAKLDVSFVSLPTSHIANAPTSEPEPPKSPAAVETRAVDTSWAIVR